MLLERVARYTSNRGGQHVQASTESQVCQRTRGFGFGDEASAAAQRRYDRAGGAG